MTYRCVSRTMQANKLSWEPVCIRSHAGFVWTNRQTDGQTDRQTQTGPLSLLKTATKGFSSFGKRVSPIHRFPRYKLSIDEKTRPWSWRNASYNQRRWRKISRIIKSSSLILVKKGLVGKVSSHELVKTLPDDSIVSKSAFSNVFLVSGITRCFCGNY